MQIDVNSILEQPGLKLHWEESETFSAEGLSFSGPLNLSFTLTNVGKNILAEGNVSGGISLSCANCLAEFVYPFSVQVSEEYFPANDVPPYAGSDVSLDELSIFTYGEDNLVDLREAVRQAILLNFPMHPLCKPDCQGLCPHCGKNKNEGECGCHDEFIDERWAPLKALEQDSDKR